MKSQKGMSEAGVLFALALLIIFFGYFSDEFLSARTLGTITTFAAVLGTIALGSTLLMIAGEYDLSVGSNAALCGMIFAMGIVEWKTNSYLIGAAAIAAGAVIGLLNGIVTLTTRIPSFITTLGTLLIWRGVVLAASGGFPISLVDDRSGLLLWFGRNLGAGFHSGSIWWIGLAIVLMWVLKKSRFGNHVFATGGDPLAARSMGVNTRRVKLICFVICGALAGLAGVMLFSELQDLSPVAGETYELYAIAAAVIGGTPLTGGAGTIFGTVLGTLLMGVVQSGLVHVGADSYWFRTFVGIMIIIAVVLNIFVSKRLTHMRTA